MKLPNPFAKKVESAPERITLPVNGQTARDLESAMGGHYLVNFKTTHHLTLEHFSYQDSSGFSPLHFAAFTGHLAEVVEVLKASGESLTREAILLKRKNGQTVADIAVEQYHIDEIFAPSLWAHHVGEMEALARRLPEEKLKAIGYEALRNEAMQLSIDTPSKPSAAFAQARRGVEVARKEPGAREIGGRS